MAERLLLAVALAASSAARPADAGCAVIGTGQCYDDGGGATRALSNLSVPGGPTTPMDHALCAQICHQHKLPLAGVEYSYQCFCGEKINKLSVTKPAGDCSSPCTANHSEPCGGTNRIWVYKYSCSGAPVPVPPPLPPPPPPPTPGPAPPPTHPIGPGGVPDCPHPELKYCNASLSLSERVGDMMSHMSPVDKLKTLGQSPSGNAPEGSSLWPRGGYRFWTEALHGVCTGCTGGTCATQFPAPSGLATAMNRTLWRAIGSAISTEARALFKFGKISGLGFFAPQLNLWTNPLWGRNLEAPGEDPYISGEYGQAWVRGLQGHNESAHGYRKAYATPKHFIGQMYESAVFPNGTLIERYRNDTRYSLHDLEFYLQPFRKAMIADGGDARSTMCAYQSVNGAPVCANGFILNKVVKAKCDPGDDATCGSWGWEGFVSSDCDSVQTMMPPLFNHAPNDHPGWPGHNYSWNGAMATADALRGGDDTNCGSIFQDDNHSGIMSLTTYPELLTEGIIDQRLRATLTNLFELGLFDGEAGGKAFDYGWEEIDSAAHRALNLEAARQSIVLLQNPTYSSGGSTDADTDAQSATAAPILPLKSGTKVAVLGYQATWTTQLMGNYNGDYSNIATIADAIRAANGAGSNTPPAVHGVPTNSIHQMGQSGFPAALEAATAAEVIILTAGLDKEVEGEGCDRSFLQLPGEQEALYTALAKLGKPIVVVLINGGMVAIDLMKDAPRTAILEASYPGARGGEGIADTIFGRSVPSGKLAATIWSKSFQNLTSVDESNLTWACSPTAIHSEWQWNPAVRAREGSDGLTHMFYQGDEANILWKFGFGLSFSEFEMSWLQPDEPAVMTIDIGAPDFVARFGALRYSIVLSNIGTVEATETVIAYWIPDRAVDETLNEQVVGFEGAALPPAESFNLSFSLPAPAELATVMEDGSRIVQPGAYTLRFSRGHGPVLEATVVLTGASRLLRRFPSAFDDGDKLTVNECDQRCNDFHPRTDLLKYKSFLWLPESGVLQHSASGKCVTSWPLVSGTDVRLLACNTSAPTPGQRWEYSGGLLKAFTAPNKPSLCMWSRAKNATWPWAELRSPVTVEPCATVATDSRASVARNQQPLCRCRSHELLWFYLW